MSVYIFPCLYIFYRKFYKHCIEIYNKPAATSASIVDKSHNTIVTSNYELPSKGQ